MAKLLAFKNITGAKDIDNNASLLLYTEDNKEPSYILTLDDEYYHLSSEVFKTICGVLNIYYETEVMKLNYLEDFMNALGLSGKYSLESLPKKRTSFSTKIFKRKRVK